jgi:DNA mismatch repair protein MutS
LTPENYIRKQTLANCERYITPELKEMESLVLNAEAKINILEYEIFLSVRNFIQDYIGDIQTTSRAIAELDALVSFAEVSAKFSYVKPKINDGDKLIIKKGRHPVIEQIIKDGVFVSNDTYVDCNSSSLLLITGPNMSGKSTYMRQTALIVLMAQIGCFVPCESAEIGIVDRIYTRIGASDNLTQGQSTFYVEMSELAYILNTSTNKSLIILDEIGRGTSTYDGLSIAWAVVEYLCHENIGTRTLFATHYHELTEMENEMKGLKNLNVEVSEENGNIVFLHKIIEGSASRSYGIHVAKLAGVPKTVLDAAEYKLLELESGIFDNNSDFYSAHEPDQIEQLSFFKTINDPLVERIKALDIMEITPSEAIKILEELKAAAK